jgi:hypothetical protein
VTTVIQFQFCFSLEFIQAYLNVHYTGGVYSSFAVNFGLYYIVVGESIMKDFNLKKYIKIVLLLNMINFFCCLFFAVLTFRSRTLSLLGRCSTASANIPCLFCCRYFLNRVDAQASLD